MLVDIPAETIELPSILPGRLLLSRGSREDHDALCRFHYRHKPPATFAAVYRIQYEPSSWFIVAPASLRTVAVVTLSFPTVALHARDRALDLTRMSAIPRLRWVNRNVRCISRVIVHPVFRALGLATLLVRHVLKTSPTRYTEALALMARAHPFFQSAGMVPYEPSCPEAPIYYLHDKYGANLNERDIP